MRSLALVALLLCPALVSSGAGRVAAGPGEAPGKEDELASLRAELARMRARLAELEEERGRREAELARLRLELAEAARERLEREEHWLRFQRTLRELRPERDTVTSVESSASAAPEDSRLARDGEIALALRSLLILEEVRGLDLLESGTLGEGATGPVVLRVLDQRGRPLGTISAERLRLEASRAAHTLTFVLEDGYERRGGETLPFPLNAEGRSERRILLPDVDPAHWADSLRELFGAKQPDAPVDDGLHDLGALRLALNDLLRADAADGYWRLRSLAGVQGRLLREVQLEELDRQGRLSRRIFADRMEARALERGVLLVLEDGAQLRGDEKTTFLDGRFRIFLPRADVERWRAAGIPGLAPGGDGDSRPDAR